MAPSRVLARVSICVALGAIGCAPPSAEEARGRTTSHETAATAATPTAIVPAFNGKTPFALSFAGDPADAARGRFFTTDLQSVSGYDGTGALAWKRSLPNLGLRTGFDWNGDGIVDVFVAERLSALTNVDCVDSSGRPAGTGTAPSSQIHLMDGASGATLLSVGAPMPDFCWNDAGTLSYYPQWTPTSIIASASAGAFAASPYYATQAWIFRQGAPAAGLVYPSTPAYDATYPNAKLRRPDAGEKYWANSHVYNGLFLGSDLGFFTSGRFVDYGGGTNAALTLDYDVPFSTNAADLGSGRNYGLVARDPRSSLVYLVAGCSTSFLLDDTLNGNQSSNPLCGIHRHVTIIDTAKQALSGTRFFSYTDGSANDSNFSGRVSFPAHPLLASSSGPSRLVYNVFDGGHWSMHVSLPGSTEDLYALADVVAWDIVDIDLDGVDEVLYSATQGYFPTRGTTVAHWEQDSKFNAVKAYAGLLPWLVDTPMTGSLSTSENALKSAVRVFGKRASIWMLDEAGATVEAEL